MMGFLPQRRLMLFFLVLSMFLGFYLLPANLEITQWWITWQTKGHTNTEDSSRTTAATRSRNSENDINSLDYWLNDPKTKGGAVGHVSTSNPTTATEPHPTTTTGQRLTKAAPTERDFFGDKYATDEPPSQTRCPGSIRKKVSGTAFAAKFLESVPVLQWAKHFSLHEYQRLAQYPGAHGWGGVDIDVLNQSLAVLNTPANRVMFDDWETRENGSLCIRCAVVGNGGILRGSRKGQEIDQHDYVFRTNGAVLQGFEEDVGTRTSHYAFSTNTLRNSMRNYANAGYLGPPLSKETRYVFLPDHDRDYILMRAAALHTPIDRGPERCTKPPQYFGDVTPENFKMYHPDFIRYLRNRFLHSNTLNTRYKDIYRPSTGAVMLLAALHTCDQVSAYGFMTPDYKKYSDHYYDKTHNPVRFYANHDLRLELNLWMQLNQAGLIKLYTRT